MAVCANGLQALTFTGDRTLSWEGQFTFVSKQGRGHSAFMALSWDGRRQEGTMVWYYSFWNMVLQWSVCGMSKALNESTAVSRLMDGQ